MEQALYFITEWYKLTIMHKFHIHKSVKISYCSPKLSNNSFCSCLRNVLTDFNIISLAMPAKTSGIYFAKYFKIVAFFPIGLFHNLQYYKKSHFNIQFLNIRYTLLYNL